MICKPEELQEMAIKCGSSSDGVHLSHFICQDPERTGGQGEGEDSPAGGQPLREEEILLLAAKHES